MKLSFKSLAVAGVLVFGALSTKAFTLTCLVQPGNMTNIFANFNNPIVVSSAQITAGTTNASVVFYDTYTNYLNYTNPAYTNIASFSTNYITSWTNFYGNVNSTTNIALIDVTNNVPQAVYPIPARLAMQCNTNSSSVYYNFKAYFYQGVWITNNSSGQATVTINYN